MHPTSENPSVEVLELMKVAAELRALGYSWGQIADKVGRDERTLRRWREDFEETWHRHFRKAEDAYFIEISTRAARGLHGLVIDAKNANYARSVLFAINKRHQMIARQDQRKDPEPPVQGHWRERIDKVERTDQEELERELLNYADYLRQRHAAEDAVRPALSSLDGPA
jgi:hypothetical protein